MATRHGAAPPELSGKLREVWEAGYRAGWTERIEDLGHPPTFRELIADAPTVAELLERSGDTKPSEGRRLAAAAAE